MSLAAKYASVGKLLEVYAKTNLGKQDALKEFEHVILIYARENHPYARTYMVPKLVKIYNKLKEQKTSTEFILICCDESEAEFNRFAKSVPFKVIPFEDPTRKALIKIFIPEMKMTALPRVITCSGKTGAVLHTHAEQALRSEAEHGQSYPWVPGAGDTAATICATCVFCTIL